MSAPQIQITEKGGMVVTLPVPVSQPAPASIGDEGVSGPSPVEAAAVPVSLSTIRKPSSLFDLETELEALLDSESLVSEEQQQEFALELQSALKAVVQKRDRVAHFLAHLESQQEFAAAETKRLQTRKRLYEAVQERVESYVIHTIQELGKDDRGKWRKLEGQTTTMALHKCPCSAAITDEQAIPAKYKAVSVTMGALLWEQILDSLDFDLRSTVLDAIRRPDASVQKSEVLKDLKAGLSVDGTRLVDDKYSLKRT